MFKIKKYEILKEYFFCKNKIKIKKACFTNIKLNNLVEKTTNTTLPSFSCSKGCHLIYLYPQLIQPSIIILFCKSFFFIKSHLF